MKDPLQTQSTPYEILGVSPSATASEIDEAFRLGLVKRGNVQKLTGAKRVLERPLDRALLDLFLYDDGVLAKLDPNPLRDPGALDPIRRAATAEAWQEQLRKTFPDPAIAHALGVLWYWSACNASEHLAQAGGRGDSGAPTWDALWQSAIGCWVFTITSPDFWRARSTARVVQQKDLQMAVTQRLASDLQRLVQSHRDAGHADVAARFQQLEMALTTEQKTAKALLAANVRSNRGVLCAGKLMLQRMDLVEKIRTQVEAALAKSPSDETLLALKDDLSPYGGIAALISNHHFEAAIEAIDSLPSKKRKLPEVRKLEARARFERGKQLASVNNINDALDCWAKAFQCAQSDDQRRMIREEVEATCIHLTASMQSQQQRDEAIRIVEKGLKAVQQSEKLSLKLADLVMQRGIETINEGQKQAEKEGQPSEAIIGMVERGVADLERAAALGSKRAAEQAEVARNVLTQIKGAHVPADVVALLKEAEAAAGREDWDRAIEKLRAVLNRLGAQAPEQIRKNLATALANRGVSRANKAVQAPGPATLERLNSALADLREAAQLDPSSEHIRENLRGIEAAVSALEKGLDPYSKPPPTHVQSVPSTQRPEERLFNMLFIIFLLIGLFAVILYWYVPVVENSIFGKILIGVIAFLWLIPKLPIKFFNFCLLGMITLLLLDLFYSDYKNEPTNSVTANSAVIAPAKEKTPAKSTLAPSPTPEQPPAPAIAEAAGVTPTISAGTGDNIEPPTLISRVNPTYPKAAKRARVQGDVVIEASINREGAVTNTRLVKGLPKGLDKAAIDAVRQWKFKPATLNGKPVDALYKLTIRFQPGADSGELAEMAPAADRVPPSELTAPPSEPPAPAWLDPQLLKQKPEVNQVTAALAQLDSATLDPANQQQLKTDINTLEQRLPALPGEARPTITLLIAAALDKLGDRTTALSYYQNLTSFDGEYGQYGGTGKLRKSEIEINDPDKLEKFHNEILEKPAIEGWFRTAGSWERTTTHRAAWLGLASLNKDKTSVSLFNWLRSRSVFPIPYAYLFVLIALTLAAKMIELPVLIQVARLNLIIPRLGSEIARIKQETAGDPMKMNSRIAELYKWHGVNPASGCLWTVIEIAFVSGVLLSLHAWAPQMALDGAKFFWVADILQPNHNLLIAWVGIGLFMIVITPQVAGAAAARLVGGLFGLSIIAAIAWFFDWPAYVMIFLVLWGLLSMWINLMLMGFLKTRT